jgi:RNA polymerase sigma-70 factor (ECF subfamily)
VRVTPPADKPPEPDDLALMAGVAEEKGGAFEALAGRWRPRLVNYFLSRGADPEAAEDCAQETLIRVFRYRHAYRPTAPYTGFLFTLARHAWTDWRRRASRWRRRDEPIDDAPAKDDVGPRALRLDLAQAVASLPHHLRDVVDLAAIRGLAYERVASLLGIPEGTVKSRMHHAVRRLRELLGDGSR